MRVGHAALCVLACIAAAGSDVSGNVHLDKVTATNVPAWVISLKRTPLRLALFKQLSSADKVFPTLKIFDAIDGKKLDLINDPRVSASGRVITAGNGATRRRHADVASPGMIGLYISHVDVWRAFLDSGAPVGVVFEDDARVPSDGALHFDKLLQSMPPADTWDVWFLGLLRMFETAPAPRSFGPGWVRPTSFFGTQAYLVTRRGARRLLEHAYPCTMQVDAFMATMSRLGQIVAVTRTDSSVQWSQFGLITGTTVQFVWCDMCDIPEGWSRAVEEYWWKCLGATVGLLLAMVPWARWRKIAQGLTYGLRCGCCPRCTWCLSRTFNLSSSYLRKSTALAGSSLSPSGKQPGGAMGKQHEARQAGGRRVEDEEDE